MATLLKVLFMFQVRARLKDLFSWFHILKLQVFFGVRNIRVKLEILPTAVKFA
ncbi:hypothetical protein RO3G_10139 [Rhizopus delemar RA 99-880]|uniref:Uncharacterized protein n=1 Tax=Rhizopus delemar (strain RA 99-880 / ATCC MYA-4621 / FGSC 9543 / NRRL 43880) TaxID=246409 RepID=I1CAE9_RHIO9|nr:hypothetical protein RO3G_10139 [Rhizopus delemar RA 99-880]|eukprot:EIE85429.1 hypothetical protein RO3G_10139 [Rhizopus delemar RA 99-880]